MLNHCSSGKHRVGHQQASGHILSHDSWAIFFLEHVSLLKAVILKTYYWLTDTELMAPDTLASTETKPKVKVSQWVQQGLLTLGNTNSVLTLSSHFPRWNHQGNTTNMWKAGHWTDHTKHACSQTSVCADVPGKTLASEARILSHTV